ncbi:MAG: alpha/beta fold hydrolase [Myxococcota bacterium]
MAELIVATVALLVIGALAWLLRVAPWRGARTRLPIVLVHGLMGFDSITLRGTSRDYFHRVATALREAGVRVYTPALPPVGSIAQRAERLAEAVRAIDARRVHVIAHSMGGLDARYAIHVLGLADRIATLTTIGTPHQGSPVADLGGLVGPLLSRVGLGALPDLTSAAARRFNEDIPDHPRVRYYSVISVADAEERVHALLRPMYRRLSRLNGDNDGVVPGSSQAWGHVIARVNSDHWGQIGWSNHYDAVPLYLQIAHRLRSRGG